MQRLLDQIEAPAIVSTVRGDYLAANALGRALYAPRVREPRAAGQQRAVHLPGPRGARLLPRVGARWPRSSSRRLRSQAGRNPYDRNLQDLIGELSTRSDEFRVRWAAHNVRFHRTGTKRLHHPIVGELELSYETLTLDADDGLRMALYTAEAGSASQQALDLLASWTATPEPTETRSRRDREAEDRSRRTTMEYRPLGRTGVQVSKLCLGTMMFGAWGNTDHDDSIRIIHRALDAGINFVDTADVYSAGESEEIVGKALKGRRDDVVLATKFCGPMGEDPNRRGGSRRWIIAEVENSLRRLGTDWIDLYQMHRPDPGHRHRRDARRADRPRPAGQGPLHRLVLVLRPARSSRRSGSRASGACERFLTEQPPYSILVRGIELDVLPTAQRHGMGILTYSPLAGGWLSGRWTRRQHADLARRRQRLAGALRHVAAREPAQARSRRAARASSPTTRACR